MIDLEHALRLALDAGDAVARTPYTVDVQPGIDDRFVRLSMMRMIGLAQREFATSVSRDVDAEDTFVQQCARAWKSLEYQHAADRTRSL